MKEFPNHSLYRDNTVNNWMIVQEEDGTSVVLHAPLQEDIISRRESSGSMIATSVSMVRSTSSRMDYLGANMLSACNLMTRRRSMRDAMLEMESGELELPPRKPSILHQQPPPAALLMPPASALGGLSALGAMIDSLGATAVAVATPKKSYTPLRIDLMAVLLGLFLILYVRANPSPLTYPRTKGSNSEAISTKPNKALSIREEKNGHMPPTFQEASEPLLVNQQSSHLDSLLSSLPQQVQQQNTKGDSEDQENTPETALESEIEAPSSGLPGFFDLLGSAQSNEQSQETIPTNIQSVDGQSSSSSSESYSSESQEEGPWPIFGRHRRHGRFGGMPNSFPVFIPIPIPVMGGEGRFPMNMFGGMLDRPHHHRALNPLMMGGGTPPGFQHMLSPNNPFMDGRTPGAPFQPQMLPAFAPLEGMREERQLGFRGPPLSPQTAGLPGGFIGGGQLQQQNWQAHMQHQFNQQQQQPGMSPL